MSRVADSINPFQLPGYIWGDLLYQSAKTLVYRAVEENSQHSVVIKSLSQDYPSFGELVQFRNQYTITQNLSIPGVVRSLGLKSFGNRYALIMEDNGGISLEHYVQRQQPLGLIEILGIALQLTDILHQLHQHRVIHKDIKPANILIRPDSKRITLIDFSIASLLPQETQTIQSPKALEGTLAYLAPEQTGRMNRAIDYRTDFYALGVSLYQLLTGQLPFTSTDPMRLIHKHIAQMPTPAEQLNSAVPSTVSAIVTKLMAKNAEDRYQSALGLKHDLEQCLIQWKETGEIVDFTLGQRDLCDRFLIPEKLYGREAEVQTLLDAFERVAQGSTELMLVAGFSGIGKTAVVNEIHKPITQQQGYFIKGKFDQFNRNLPLSAFVQAFRDLMGQLLSESDQDLTQWKTKILRALGDSAQVIIDVVPELETILGTQPPVPELSGNSAENRFNRLFQKFMGVFTTAKHSLVMFLDDLQWADVSSLNLLKTLMENAETDYLLLLGAYRDNEVYPAHPLMLTLGNLTPTAALISTITLTPLAERHINQLVAETLSCSHELAQSLTQLLYQKTQGNPFFTTQVLKELHEETLITFNAELGYWECDLGQVRDAMLSEDVVELMTRRLQKLPESTQKVLTLAACLGHQFDLDTLAAIQQTSSEAVAKHLWSALQEGMVIPLNEAYKFFQGATNLGQNEAVTVTYRFLHDRVQQGAYALIDEADKASTHYQIGQRWLNKLTSAEQEENIFALVGQFNLGKSLITRQAEQDALARLNLRACRKAKAATAYQAGCEYAVAGLALLGDRAWAQQYDMALAFHTLAAEMAALSGDFETMEKFAEAAIRRSLSLLDCIEIYQTQIGTCASRHQPAQAIEIAQKVLHQFGVELPEQPTEDAAQQALVELSQLLENQDIDSLADLPMMQNREAISIIEIANSIAAVATISAPNLLPVLTVLCLKLHFQHGNTISSASSYARCGMLACTFLQAVEVGVKLGELALKMVEQPEARALEPEILAMVGFFLTHRKFHLKEALKLSDKMYAKALAVGYLEYAGYSANQFCLHAFWSSYSLPDLAEKAQIYCQGLTQLNQFVAVSWCRIHWQSCLNLIEHSTRGNSQPDIISGQELQESEVLSQLLEIGDIFGLCILYSYKLPLAYLFGNFAAAQRYAREAERYIQSGMGSVLEPAFYLYDSLTVLEASSSSEALTRVEHNQTKLQHWAKYAPMNYQHKVDLVTAERCRVLGKKLEALEYYDRAIAGARANEYTQEEALANELAAKFYLDWDKEKVAAGYMQEAYYCYARWGAKAKVADLETCYPALLSPILQQPATSSSDVLTTLMTITAATTSVSASAYPSHSSTNLNKTLDFASIFKASQSLSSTIQLDDLLRQLTQIILQNSGADFCALILPTDRDDWQVRVIATPTETKMYREALTHNEQLPINLIQYVKNVQETVVVNDVANDLPVIDNYFEGHPAKSVLCLPLFNQDQLRGVVYLSNQLTAGAFTREHILMLNFLCTQATISLVNARLYDEAQQHTTALEQSILALEQAKDVLANNERRMERQVTALVELSQSPSITQGKTQDAFTELTEITASTLQIERVSIWLLDEQQTKIECADLWIASTQQHSAGSILKVEDYPAYFAAIQAEPILSAQDAWNDERTLGFREGYLDVLNIVSMLDASFYIDSQARGVICCEQVGEKRDWSKADQNFVRSVANLIALTLEADRHHQKSNDLNQALADLKTSQLKLVQGEKMSALGGLVAGVAHEINNPVGCILGNVGATKAYISDLLGLLDLYAQQFPHPGEDIEEELEAVDLAYVREDLPKLIRAMKDSGDRIKSISKSLRTFSRADQDSKQSFELHEGIESTVLILRHRLKANEQRPAIKVVKDYGELPSIDCFPGQLNQVFMNLLANAIDVFDEVAGQSTFAELKEKPQIITVKTAILTEEKAVEIRIGDNGKGMPEAVKARIFDHLFTTKGVGKGTGLGLAIAQQIIVEAHGGTIAVQSEPEQGTEFCIRLPI